MDDKLIDFQLYLKGNKANPLYSNAIRTKTAVEELFFKEAIKTSFLELIAYCEKENFKGWDPYDGLRSPLIRKNPLWRIPLIRLMWIQAFKKSPFNLRKIFFIDKDFNPKGLALFITAYCNLYKIEKKRDYLDIIEKLSNKLIDLRSENTSGAAWGYNFPWQSKVGLFPEFTPTVVTTAFASYALMEAFECTNISYYLETALSSSEFVLNDLKRTPKNGGFLFSYSPVEESCVYNASLLGSRLLSQCFKYNKDDRLLEYARSSILACVKEQRDDGAWPYGELPFQNWVDSFHTGYNLECINEYQLQSGDPSFSDALEKGYAYYIENFFRFDGTPKYYDKKIYPIDIHCPSQFIVTLFKLGKLSEKIKLAEKVINYTIMNLQDKEEGYFYYQSGRFLKNKIPYMRWSQAWMLYALSFYFLELKR